VDLEVVDKHLWMDLEAVDFEADLETVDLQAVNMEALPVEVVVWVPKN
jgi:hypothetical protein